METTRQEPRPSTLTEFIAKNATLITSLAAFAARTALSLQLEKIQTNLALSAAALLGALVIGLELFSNLPEQPRHWRLELFHMVLFSLLVLIAWYWLSQFPNIWVPVLLGLVGLLLMILVLYLRKIYADLFTRVAGGRFKRFERGTLYSILFLIAGICLWIMHKYGGRQVQIKLPHL